MKKIFLPAIAVLLFAACNNSTGDKPTGTNETAKTAADSLAANTDKPTPTTGATLNVTVDGQDLVLRSSALVGKDKKNLSPGNEYDAMVTANGSDSNKTAVILHFLFSLKPGTYPVTGYSLQRHVNSKGQMFGGLLGGEARITPYKMTIASCDETRAHHWKISGTVDDMEIEAMNIMKMDPTNHHPDKVNLSKISFANIEFDDNIEELMKEMFKKK